LHPLIGIAAGALLTIAAVLSLGRLAWRFRPPHWTSALASGAPLLSLAIFALLSAGHASSRLVLSLCLLAASPLFFRPPRLARPVWPHWSAVAFLPFLVLYLANALAPEIQPDAVTYHLGLVAGWIRTGGFASRIGFYDLLPLGAETLFFPATLAGGYSAAKLVHLAFLCASVPLIVRLGLRLGLDRRTALAAAGLYALAPAAGAAGAAAYNDAALVFFSLAAFALLVEDASQPSDEFMLHAGLAAGFCYAIKVTGALSVAALLAWLLWRRRWRGAALASAGALVSTAPWMLRNLLLTANPIAPLGNRIFPNDAFHAFTETALARYLSDYGGLPWTHIPHALGLDGAALQGLIGPVIFLLPLSLLALRGRAGRAVLAAAFVLLLPWTRNIGARFFLPGFALLALALCIALPPRLAPLLLCLHAALSWPSVLDRYSNPAAWRLHGIPWQAALRLVPEEKYLEQHLAEYRLTRLAAQKLRDNEPLLDLHGLPFAYLNTVPTGPLSSAQFDNIVQTLNLAYGAEPERLYPFECRFPLQFARAIRIRLEQPCGGPWSIAEVQLQRRGAEVPVSRNWLLSAWPEPGDAWLAIDRNRATRWFTWEAARPGMFWQLTFDRPIPIDGATALLPGLPRRALVGVYVQGLDRQWRDVSTRARTGPPWRVFYKRAAMRSIRQQGFRWIATHIGGEGHGPTGESLASLPEAWDVELAARDGDLALFHLR
jgi:hypothetical protein